MKKVMATVLSLVMCFGLLAGCGGDDSTTSNNTNANNDTQETKLSGVVNTDGSTSMEKVVKGLAEVFMEENSDVTVNYSGTGSGSGVEAAVSGTADIGLASRSLKDEEKAKGAVEHIVALDGVAVVVNLENDVTDLTVEQIAQIFTGEITNWSELGGSDAPIAVYGREANSGTRGAFEEIVDVEDACAYVNEYSSTGDMVGSIAGNPNAIGYASLSAVNGAVKAVKVNGVDCTENTIKDGSYEIQRPFVMITKEGVELSPAAQAFLDYAKSDAAAEIIAIAGAVAP